MDDEQAKRAIVELVAMPLLVYPSGALLNRLWELRDNLTVYDASYVALAETLGCTLLTADGRVARAPGINCLVEVP